MLKIYKLTFQIRLIGLFFCFAAYTLGQNLILDPTFGTNGLYTFSAPNTGFNTFSLVKQQDEKFIHAIRIQDLTNGQTLPDRLIRFNTNGTIDNTFGNGGEVELGGDFNLSYGIVLNECVKLQSDDKIIVVGQAFTGSQYFIRVKRFLINGQLDTSFGTNGEFNYPAGDIEINCIEIQDDGNIILGGFITTYGPNQNDFFLMRLTPSGVLDNTFGTNGILNTDFNSLNDQIQAIRIQSDGKIVAVGRNESFDEIIISRYQNNGTLDATFEGDGKVIIGGMFFSNVVNAELQSDDKLLISYLIEDGNGLCGIFRLNIDGTIDNSYGTNGFFEFSYETNVSLSLISAMEVKSTGQLICVGISDDGTSTNSKGTISQLNLNSGFDNSFDDDGVEILDLGIGNTGIIDVVTQLDGKIVVIGANDYDIFIARFQLSCLPDQTGAINGSVTPLSGDSEVYSIQAVQGADSYIWTLPNGWTGSSSTNSITVNVGSSAGIIQVKAVNSCGESIASTLEVDPFVNINHDWLWAKNTNDNTSTHILNDMVTDPSGNVYFVGSFIGSVFEIGGFTLTNNGASDIFIVKMDPNGNVLWVKGAGGNGSDVALGVDYTISKELVVVGTFSSNIMTFGGHIYSHSGVSGDDMFLLKMDSDGILGVEKEFDYSTDLWVEDVTVDNQNNIIVVGEYSSAAFNLDGYTLGSVSNTNSFIVKMNVVGDVLWALSANSPDQSINYSKSVKHDSENNLYISGTYYNTSTMSFNGYSFPVSTNAQSFFVMKLNTDGFVEWLRTSDPNISYTGSNNFGNELTVDSNDNVIVTGYFENYIFTLESIPLTNSSINLTPEIFVVKFDKYGVEQWARSAGGIGDDSGLSIDADIIGNVYVSGYSKSLQSSFGSFTMNQSSASPTLFVTKYAPNGSEEWLKYVPNTTCQYSNGLCVDNDGNVFVGGSNLNNANFGNTNLSFSGLFIAKLGETTANLHVEDDLSTSILIYPNPTSNSLSLISNDGAINRVIVRDLSGKICLDQNNLGNEYSLDVKNLSNGTYIIECNQNSRTTVKKLIIVH